MSVAKYYAVACGRNPGVYYSWEECERETKGWPNARYKKFDVEQLAWDFVKANCPNMKLSAGSSPVKKRPHGIETTNSTSTKFPLLERIQKIEDRIQQFHESIMVEIASLKEECLLPGVSVPKKITLVDLEDAPPPFTQPKICFSGMSAARASKKVKLDDSAPGCSSNTFKVDADGYVEVYTDGACSKNGFKGAQAGIGVWFGDGHSLNISEPVKGRITNNSAEIEAATAAIEAAHAAGIKKLKLYTDSSFLISAITSWIKKWEKNGWKTANGDPVKNKEELILLKKAHIKLDVTFVHVKGHAGNYENEMADSLARAGAEKCTPSKMF
ncbi:ribonuclease H1 isoform X2 [Hetaerina americana]|uniref:ribonuclease H1 isoform X2 n=1 Tax=Hetaerina americana TaxID=62018 RepID=UPI003A7F52D8